MTNNIFNSMIRYQFPRGWYWKADDGRIYSAAAQLVVNDQDAGYLNFLSLGGAPTIWPRDDVGQQTNAALLAVISAYSLIIG